MSRMHQFCCSWAIAALVMSPGVYSTAQAVDSINPHAERIVAVEMEHIDDYLDILEYMIDTYSEVSPSFQNYKRAWRAVDSDYYDSLRREYPVFQAQLYTKYLESEYLNHLADFWESDLGDEVMEGMLDLTGRLTAWGIKSGFSDTPTEKDVTPCLSRKCDPATKIMGHILAARAHAAGMTAKQINEAQESQEYNLMVGLATPAVADTFSYKELSGILAFAESPAFYAYVGAKPHMNAEMNAWFSKWAKRSGFEQEFNRYLVRYGLEPIDLSELIKKAQ